MPPVLRRTLSAPAARVSAAPYTRRSGTTQRRVLGDLAGEQLIEAARRNQNIPPPTVTEVQDAEVAMEAIHEPVVEDVPLAPIAPAVPTLVTGLAALSLAPQTPTRRRTLRREPSFSPSLSDASSISSRRSSVAPLDAPDFGTPESSPRRTRSKRARALQRTLSEPLIPSTPSRRRRLARTSSTDTISDENAPIVVRDLFN